MIDFAKTLRVSELGFAASVRASAGAEIVVTTDGVGTKLMCERVSGHTIGYDVVAANINDLWAAGAKPIGFLDYIATGTASQEYLSRLVMGIRDGCEDSGNIPILGGETAVMPERDFEVVGFALGQRCVKIQPMAAGDRIWAFPSRGPQTNGYTSLRKRGIRHGDLWMPSINYHKVMVRLWREHKLSEVSGLAHISGGGLEINLKRTLPSSGGLRICLNWELLEQQKPEWVRLAEVGISRSEARREFNYGWGFAIISRSKPIPGATLIGTIQKEY